jgi:hypothetical protein
MKFAPFLACVLLWACAEPTPSLPARQDSALGQVDAPLYVAASGHYSRYVYHGVSSQSFWVDLNVANDSPTKEVGIVWSTNGFLSQQSTRAVFEADLGGGRERWGIDVRDFTNHWGGTPIEVEYAAYVTMNGRTEWSAQRNHFIYDVVTAEKPVRLLKSSVALSEGVAHLTGRVRALNVEERRVFVRYTTDEWASEGELEASFDGKDFAFDVALPLSNAHEAVEFAVRLEADDEEAWDNKSGANYRHQLAPSLGAQWITPASDVGLNGVLVLDASVTTELGVDGAYLQFDAGSEVALPEAVWEPMQTALGYSKSGVHWAFATDDLAEGPHTVTLTLEAGPFRRTLPPLSFTVDRRVQSLDSLELVEGTTAWDFAFDAKGGLYVATDRQVFVYDQLGGEPRAFSETPEAGYLRELTVDDRGRVYALHTRDALARWLPDGTLDASFGTNGVRILSENYGSSTLCFPADIVVYNERLVIVDSCNARLLRLTLEGDFIDERALDGMFAGRVKVEGPTLWISTLTFDALSQMHVSLVALDDAFREVETVELDARIGQIEAFAVDDAGIWVSGYDGVLHRAARDGTADVGFAGGFRSLDLPGANEGLSVLQPLTEGRVLGLDRSGNQLELFGERE